MNPNDFGLGLRMHTDQELSQTLAVMGGALTCAAPTNIPTELLADWFLQDNQSLWPFCHAHMRTGSAEVLAWMASRGKTYQFSRKFSAITDMRMDGNDASPAGASIPGSMRASLKYGEVLESDCPYFPVPAPNEQVYDVDNWCRQHYSNKLDPALFEQAAKHQIKTLVPNIRSYDQMDAGLISGNVVMPFGMTWTEGWASVRGVESTDRVGGGRVLGGHALFAFGWITKAGERWHRLNNSHLGWGKKMGCYLAPRLWDNILSQSQYGAFFASDMALLDIPRGWDWLDSMDWASIGKTPPKFV